MHDDTPRVGPVRQVTFSLLDGVAVALRTRHRQMVKDALGTTPGEAQALAEYRQLRARVCERLGGVGK
jgi:hypothetical protein